MKMRDIRVGTGNQRAEAARDLPADLRQGGRSPVGTGNANTSARRDFPAPSSGKDQTRRDLASVDFFTSRAS